jgi:hypothetical protein
MKRSFALSIVLVLAAALTARAGLVSLVAGDTATFKDQTSGASAGDGGQFDWTIASTVNGGQGSSPVGTAFQTFCVDIGAFISQNDTYKINSIITPAMYQESDGNSPSNENTKGLYLFNEWSNGLITHNATNAGAVQVALWESMGYTDTYINNNTSLNPSSYQSTIATLAAGWTSSWTPPPTEEVLTLLNSQGDPAQDQIVSLVPEPTTLAIWGLGVGLAGAAAMRRRKQSHGRWSAENRQAIFEVIDGKR